MKKKCYRAEYRTPTVGPAAVHSLYCDVFMTQVKFYNCHVKRSEIWFVLPTPGKSTVWTWISCQGTEARGKGASGKFGWYNLIGWFGNYHYHKPLSFTHHSFTDLLSTSSTRNTSKVLGESIATASPLCEDGLKLGLGVKCGMSFSVGSHRSADLWCLN